jgi:hypothetical protein
METMRALVAKTVGEPADVLRLETKTIPTAGQGQVRVRVKVAPINPNDLDIMRGRYGIAPPMPTPLGQAAVGVVASTSSQDSAITQLIIPPSRPAGRPGPSTASSVIITAESPIRVSAWTSPAPGPVNRSPTSPAPNGWA